MARFKFLICWTLLTGFLTLASTGLAINKVAAETSDKIRIEQINLTGSLTPVSLYADGISDLIVSVPNSNHGTISSGEIIILANQARLDAGLPGLHRQPGKKSGHWWANNFVLLQSFLWSAHVGGIFYTDVQFFRTYVGGKFAGFFIGESVLKQSPEAQSMEDTSGAEMTLNVYKICDEKGHITGYNRDISIKLVASGSSAVVTGDPSELKPEFDRLISGALSP